jgi:Icc protein
MQSTILQLSDIHFAATPGETVHGADPDGRLRTVLDAWRALDGTADLILLTGDLTEDGSSAAYERLATVISALDVPALAIPGNHDDPDLVAEYFETPELLALGAWQVVCVDTALPGEIHGMVDVPMLDATLAALDAPVLVAMHHPPVSRSTHEWFRLEQADLLLACLQGHPQVRGLVAGHTHEPFDAVVDNSCQILGCPSTLIGIAHDGAEFVVGGATPTGARVLGLRESGDLASRLLFA